MMLSVTHKYKPFIKNTTPVLVFEETYCYRGKDLNISVVEDSRSSGHSVYFENGYVHRVFVNNFARMQTLIKRYCHILNSGGNYELLRAYNKSLLNHKGLQGWGWSLTNGNRIIGTDDDKSIVLSIVANYLEVVTLDLAL